MRTHDRRAPAVLLSALAASLLAAPALPSDDDLQRRIEARFAKADLGRRADIRVEVESGVARLTGITLSYPDLREADRLARRETKGVVNLLRVVPEAARSDRAIRFDAESEVLRWERYGPFDAVGIDVAEGVIQLSGWVENSTKRDEIEERLARVVAIRDVVNNLRVQGFSAGDESLRRQVYLRIYRDPLFERFASYPDPPVRVFVDRGRVTLAGTVGSAVEQTALGFIARGTLAFSVDNHVQIEGEAARKADGKSRNES
jgi:osmotically-inducible protein OsmY